MDNVLVVIILAWCGLIFGSFAGAQVWRLRARQLVEDERDGESVDEAELRRLRGLIRPAAQDRSECLTCHHQLVWYDLLPLVSWLSTGGRCRYCHTRIGWFEPAMELGVASAFVLSYLYWPVSILSPLEIIRFCLWLIACVCMAMLFAYDAKWYLLPFRLNILLIVIAAIFAALTFIGMGHVEIGQLISAGIGILLLAGLYFVFSLFGWTGLGDSILGVGLSLLLLDWPLAFVAMFLANLIGCLALIPLAIRGKLRRGAKVPFGPFLIIGTFIAMLWGHPLIQATMGSSFLLY